jgi:hypothetical protein
VAENPAHRVKVFAFHDQPFCRRVPECVERRIHDAHGLEHTLCVNAQAGRVHIGKYQCTRLTEWRALEDDL